MDNNEILKHEEVATAECIIQSTDETITQTPKSNKKKIIVISAVAAVVIICIISVITAAVNKSNSLWAEPLNEDAIEYGYKLTPEEFIDRANELSIGDVNHEFEYNQTKDMDEYERYIFDICSGTLMDNPVYYSSCGVDYYKNDAIYQTILAFDYQFDDQNVYSFDWAYDDLSISAVQILYAYDAFDADSAKDVLNTFKAYSDEAEQIIESQNLKIFLKYGEFVILIWEEDNSLYLSILKTDEKGIARLEEILGSPMTDLTNISSQNNDNSQNFTAEQETRKSPDNYAESTVANTQSVYVVKSFNVIEGAVIYDQSYDEYGYPDCCYFHYKCEACGDVSNSNGSTRSNLSTSYYCPRCQTSNNVEIEADCDWIEVNE